MWDFDSHLDYSQYLSSRVSPLFFFFFHMVYFLSGYEWPLWLWICGQSHRWPLFGYGYAVSHSEPSALILVVGIFLGFWKYERYGIYERYIWYVIRRNVFLLYFALYIEYINKIQKHVPPYNISHISLIYSISLIFSKAQKNPNNLV